MWRNYGDIQDSWDSVLNIIDWFFDNQDILGPAAGPGRWNDPDMVGKEQFTSESIQVLVLPRCNAIVAFLLFDLHS